MENNSHLIYENGAWAGRLSDVAIFDSEFVEQNVYSGFAVRPDQRQALLDFALGDTTVDLKKRIDGIAKSIKEKT